MTRSTDRAPDESVEGWTVPVDPANPRLGRRTVLAGAAWSLPVIAASIATPLTAASALNPTLEFLGGPFGASVCNTLADIVLQATTDGTTPAANALVTVSLPAGLTWSDGTTGVRVLQADAAGQVVLLGVTASSAAGSFDITATHGSASTSTSIGISATSTAQYYQGQTGLTRLRPTIPAGAEPVGYDTWLAANGDLYTGQPPRVVATGVTSASAQFSGANDKWYVFYTDASGAAKYRRIDGGAGGAIPTPEVVRSGVPSGSTNIGYDTWLMPNGDLYYANTRIATGVTEAHTEYNPASGIAYVFYSGPGGTKYYQSQAGTTVVRTVPAGSKAVGFDTWLAPNGNLYYGNTRIATGVTSATSALRGDGTRYIDYVDGSGAKVYDIANNRHNTRVGIPVGSTAEGFDVWRTPSGDLYRGTKKIGSNVGEVYYEVNPINGLEAIFYTTTPSC